MKAKYYKDDDHSIWKQENGKWFKYNSDKDWHDPAWINYVAPAEHWKEISESDAFEFVMMHPYVQPPVISLPFSRLVLPMMRRVFPELITNEIIGVQPMSAPTGLAFAYDNKKKRKNRKKK